MSLNEMPYWRQLLWARHVYWTLLVKHIAQRYHNTVLGFFWTLLGPLLSIMIYVAVFSLVFRIQMENYPIYLLTSMLPFNFFKTAIESSANSLYESETYFTRHYLPKMVFPMVAVSIALFDFVTSYSVLLCLGAFIGFRPSYVQLIVPFSLVVLILFTLGCSFIASILGAYFADTRQAVVYVMQALLFVTPVLYPTSMAPDSMKSLLALNPLTYFVSNFNLPLYYHQAIPPMGVMVSILLAFGSLIVGLAVFRKYEVDLVFRL
jgi:ABC-type polysaccharide/polyol phosphate export permease